MKYKILIILVFVVGIFLRFYNFENRLIFGPEQAISLINSASNLDKFSLLGEYNLQRTTSTGLNLIHGPLFSYFLLPFIVLFNFRALPISLVFPVLNLLTALILFIITCKLFNKIVGFFTLFYFLFSSLMIYHSLFIWIYNPIPLLGVLTIWFISQLIKNKSKISSGFWLGLVSGIGFSLQYPYLFFAGLIFILCIFVSQKRLLMATLYAIGFLCANITRVIFDFRHDLFHVRVLWEFFLDVYVRHTVTASTYYYHYLHLFPVFCLLIALFTVGLYRIHKLLAVVILVAYLIVNFQSPNFNLKKSIGMPDGITLKTLESATNTIAKDSPPAKFNVVTLWDFDTLARPMRYLLKYYYHLIPQPFENYANVDAIYAFAPASYDIQHPGVWELKTFAPYKVELLASPSAKYLLYKLVK